MNQKVSEYARAMISAFFVLFTLIIVWNVLTPTINSVFDTIRPRLENNSDGIGIINQIYTSWLYYPIIAIIAIIVFMIVRGIAKEQYEY